MKISSSDIDQWDRNYRVKFMNSLSGYKGVHLIGTVDADRKTNLAIFNSVIHIGANPPLMGFIMRPLSVPRHTYENIQDTREFTINHIHANFVEKAHYTSGKFEKGLSEFERCALKEEYITGFKAPFVQDSKVKIGLEWVEEKKIESNDTLLIIGQVKHVLVDEQVVGLDGQLDLQMAKDVVVTGLNQYSVARKVKNLPYVRLEEVPEFDNAKRPDNVAFDVETQSYNSNILPYGTNIGAPSILPTSVSNWKNGSISSFNHSLNNKVEELKNKYQHLIEEYKVNDRLYACKMNFEPIVGQVYHLYENDEGDEFLSIISPKQWNQKYIGTYKLNHEKVWEPLTEE